MSTYILDSLQMPDGNDYVIDQRGNTFFGHCNTQDSTAAKTVSIDGFTSENLKLGTKITVNFANGNTASPATLNVSGTGAKNLVWAAGTEDIRFSSSTCVDLIYIPQSSWVVVGSRQYTFFGVCSTSASAKDKTALITGFGSSSLINGARVMVFFEFGQTYNGNIRLQISGTGYKNVTSADGVYVGQYEWRAGQIVTFVYCDGLWIIEDGAHADTTYWGKTKLSNTIADNETVALTPKAVYDAGFLTLADLPVWDGSVT